MNKHKKIKKAILRKREKRRLKRENKAKLKQWVKEVKKRDKYTCQVCKTYYGEHAAQSLQAMHILSKENYPELMFDIMNGLAGCYYCHMNAPISSHHDGFAFTIWLKKHRTKQYRYIMNKLNKSQKTK